MSATKTVTLIAGDGIGPEIAAATEEIIAAAGAKIEFDRQVAGGEAFAKGVKSGVPEATIESIHRTRVVLKGPLATPVGHGERSANVTLRKLFETFGNIRPARELPGVATPYAGRNLDIVVVRENVEDLYAGIEYMQTPGVAEALKIISRKGCEKIARLAFEFARSAGRRKVTCATKANIMKLTEGMLKRVFEEVAPEYGEIESDHVIVDNCAHLLAKRPEVFDVIVTTNMNGDILSDLTSGLVGGLGFAPSANIGANVAIFEAVHGTAPDIAGQNKANPTSLALSAVMMLRHLGEFGAADAIEHALLVTLEDGKALTGDIAPAGQAAAGTTEFAAAVIANLGRRSQRLPVRQYKPLQVPELSAEPVTVTPGSRRGVGFDIFVESGQGAAELEEALSRLAEGSPFRLEMISNRGATVFPDSGGFTDCVDHWRCRFKAGAGTAVTDEQVLPLVQKIGEQFSWMHIEKLSEFDGKAAYSES
ncbi:MAG TPA: NADP-dependent isocitrate dehydrogenase [candidate division Zixibacteria bacterium]|nr:NADP-dependent isocitrate dehydrogenase [candidate division Zixibacteria bacterium]